MSNTKNKGVAYYLWYEVIIWFIEGTHTHTQNTLAVIRSHAVLSTQASCKLHNISILENRTVIVC